MRARTDSYSDFEQKNASRLFKLFERPHEACEFSGVGVGVAVEQRIISDTKDAFRRRASPAGVLPTFDVAS